MLASSCSSGEPGEAPFHRQVTSESPPITRIAPAERHLRRTHHHPAIDGHRSPRVVRKDRTKDIPAGLSQRAREVAGGTESSQTPRRRKMDSNFQYAGAVNLVIAPFCAAQAPSRSHSVATNASYSTGSRDRMSAQISVARLRFARAEE